MRIAHIVLVCVAAAGCQSTQQEGAPVPGAGATTLVQGTPDTIRSDTTFGARNEESQPSGVTLTLDLTSYAPGGTVAMRIRNGTNDELGFNQCSSRTVERQEGTSWVPHPEPGRMCTMQLQIVMPNDTTTATTDLPHDLRVGSYRIVLIFSRQTASNPGSVRAISPTFRVT